MVRTGIGQIRILFDIVFNPQNLIESSSQYTDQSAVNRLSTILSVTVFFLLNVVLYALPLSLQGIGFVDANIILLLINNSISIVSFGFLTYSLYHSGIWLVRGSNGLIPSYRIVMINTSIYLAIIFNLLWIGIFISNTLTGLFNWAFQVLFETVGYYIAIPPGFGDGFNSINPAEVSSLLLLDRAIIVGLLISSCYYLYVLYIGARRVHGLTRYESVLVMGFVLSSPITFAAISLIIGEYLNIPSFFKLGA